jgi:hypothetical protein
MKPWIPNKPIFSSLLEKIFLIFNKNLFISLPPFSFGNYKSLF